MIKFFRKIRFDLMEKNRTGKYLKYAIGEIVLVVIGILIALSINNWNEIRKQRLEEVQILKNIQLGYQNVIAECEENNEFRKQILDATKKLYSLIGNNQQNFSKTELDSLLAILFINPTYNNQTGSLNILFNSGKINLITNENIKESLIKWPQRIDDVIEDELYASNHLLNELKPYMRKYISISDVNKAINYKNLELFDTSIKSKFESNYSKMLNDIEFEGILAARELPLSVSLIQSEDLITTAKNIIELIDKELGK